MKAFAGVAVSVSLILSAMCILPVCTAPSERPGKGYYRIEDNFVFSKNGATDNHHRNFAEYTPNEFMYSNCQINVYTEQNRVWIKVSGCGSNLLNSRPNPG